MPQRELTSRENGAARSLHLVDNRRKLFLPSSTAAARNDSVRPEKTGTLFLFSSESSSVLWVYAGLHEVSMNAASPPLNTPGTRIPESRVPSFSHAFFFSLSQLWLDELQGQSCEAMAHFFILPAPLLLLSSGSTFTRFPCCARVTRV